MSSSEIEVRSRPTVAKPKSDNQAQQVIKAPAGPRAQGKAASLESWGKCGKKRREIQPDVAFGRGGPECSGAFLFCFCRYQQYRIGVM
jgi:hypothetical protein